MFFFFNGIDWWGSNWLKYFRSSAVKRKLFIRDVFWRDRRGIGGRGVGGSVPLLGAFKP